MSANSNRVSKWRLRKKERLLEAFGNCCGICGYDKCKSALEFHHLDPTQKEFTISTTDSSGKGWKQIVSEIEKCVLLCANCHREVHSGVTQIPDGITRFDRKWVDYSEVDVQNSCPVCGESKSASNGYCSTTCRSSALARHDWDKFDIEEMLKVKTRAEVATIIGCTVPGLDRYRRLGNK
ncbi:MAG: HNH endonuclease [Hydrotalea sp. AMD]|uniref:HNH endonuclease signature motif containing protein n=1 Tax=Hydrotalea sp. AMD TaxID=2501297 RepID=UPI0010258364|nr:HNH endonuclease signature motif containing protein [Hydrotalea sp. AMD]RWZ87220.1 MAG: HNH endonuclease [Hydrotalea sp. AMD]